MIDRRGGLWMKCVALVVLSFLAASCEPFMLSPFPGYLPDVTATVKMTDYFSAGEIEQYDLCALKNGTTENVFVLQ